MNVNADNELRAPPQTGGFRNHHGEVIELVNPIISEEKKRVYKAHFDEEWFQEKCIQW